MRKCKIPSPKFRRMTNILWYSIAYIFYCCFNVVHALEFLGDSLEEITGYGTMRPKNLISSLLGQTPVKSKSLAISNPHDFRQVNFIANLCQLINFGHTINTKYFQTFLPLIAPITQSRSVRFFSFKVSAIIDVDIVPETCRRVRLLKHGSDKPLGFYIRDGTSVKVTSNGIEKQPGIFISRLVPGGLAESTGLLAVNDEVNL